MTVSPTLGAISGASAPAARLTPVPTTKILAIGHLSDELTFERRKVLMPKEVSDTVRLYLAGKIDQWWAHQDFKGVVFLMNATSVEEAQRYLDTLALVRERLLTFELIALGPCALTMCCCRASALPSMRRPSRRWAQRPSPKVGLTATSVSETRIGKLRVRAPADGVVKAFTGAINSARGSLVIPAVSG
jgi:hypothetical protein